MSQWKRLLFYLTLNILVSACVTLAVLWVWDSSRFTSVVEELIRNNPLSSAPTQAPDLTLGINSQPTPASTPIPVGEIPELILIDNVFGVGDLDDEVVLLKRTGKGELILNKWKLKDADGNTYLFPVLTLFEGGAVQIHTNAGVDSVVDLYWGLPEEVWQAGEIVTLLDDQSNIRATYRIP